MSRPFLLILILPVLLGGGGYIAGWRGDMDVAKKWFAELWEHQLKRLDKAQLESTALAALQDSRATRKLRLLEPDPELYQLVQNKLRHSSRTELPDLLEAIQKSRTDYARVAALSTQCLTPAGQKDEISRWRDGSASYYNQVAAVADPGFTNMGLGTILILGEKLPTLSPEALNDTPATMFYTVCPHCRTGARCELARRNFTTSLECPACHHITTVLASDLQGKIHYANEYLTGYAPPAHFPPGCTKLDEMLIIWRAVGEICHYKRDGDEVVNDPGDAWQFALETQKVGTGDCEDSAIMLADWLCSRGIEARVALGRYAERGGHAWVVAHLEGQEYLLESTLPDSRPGHLPRVSEVGSRYVPEAMLDYESIYVREAPRELWEGGYFAQQKWLRIVPRKRPPATPPQLATSFRSAIIHSVSTAAAPR